MLMLLYFTACVACTACVTCVACVACVACVVEGNRYRSALADIRKVLMIDPTIRVMHLPPSLSAPLPRVAHKC